jgi:hypothetical protein
MNAKLLFLTLAGMSIATATLCMHKKTNTPLVEAVEQNNMDLVTNILTQNPTIDPNASFRTTAANIAIIQLLLKKHLRPIQIVVPIEESRGDNLILVQESRFWATTYPEMAHDIKKVADHIATFQGKEALLACLKINKHTKKNIEQAEQIIEQEKNPGKYAHWD